MPADTTATTERAEGFDGEWTVTADSEFGYRVAEVLAGIETEAVGRGNEISGSFTVAGTEITDACFVVQVASITSDEAMRDGQFNGRIMETGTYPTATFALAEPIVLDGLPEVGGDAITVSATGDLTLHGVTTTVTFEVTVQAGDDVIGVLERSRSRSPTTTSRPVGRTGPGRRRRRIGVPARLRAGLTREVNTPASWTSCGMRS